MSVDIGNGASCHVGYKSCFYRSIPLGKIENSEAIELFVENSLAFALFCFFHFIRPWVWLKIFQLMDLINSFFFSKSLRMTPVKCIVFMTAPCFFIPLEHMQWCSASTITPTPKQSR